MARQGMNYHDLLKIEQYPPILTLINTTKECITSLRQYDLDAAIKLHDALESCFKHHSPEVNIETLNITLNYNFNSIKEYFGDNISIIPSNCFYIEPGLSSPIIEDYCQYFDRVKIPYRYITLLPKEKYKAVYTAVFVDKDKYF